MSAIDRLQFLPEDLLIKRLLTFEAIEPLTFIPKSRHKKTEAVHVTASVFCVLVLSTQSLSCSKRYVKHNVL